MPAHPHQPLLQAYVITPADLSAIWLSLKLATAITLILLIIGTPLAWWLARTRSCLRATVCAVVALHIVLPPTVMDVYAQIKSVVLTA